MVQAVFDWLDENGMCQNIVAISRDSIAINTEWKRGALHFVVEEVGEKDGIASMHTNELPLRHLIIDLDRPTQSDNAFVGTIGKLVTIETELYLNDSIPSIDIHIELIELEDDFVQNLSDEQKYLYQITRGIKAGSFPDYLRERGI